MEDNFKRFDMAKAPKKTKWFLKPLIPLLCKKDLKKHKSEIEYVGNVKDIKAPFLLLCNHNAFLDFKVATKALGKNEANYIVAIDGFLINEWLLRNVGCICKRKFTNDTTLIKNIKKAINMGNSVVIYPEARYSLCGTTAILPKSLGKLAKFLKVPVLTLICHGHHINSPFWDTSHDRGISPVKATYKELISIEEIEKLSVDEINELIVNEFQYDDFKWQKENNIIVNDPKRCEGLHRVLYKCPYCMDEYNMSSKGTILKCNNCNTEIEMSELGELKCLNNKDVFTHIPDWYEWERMEVKKEVLNGTYSTGILECQVDSLPNAKGYVDLGKGTLIHDMEGFKVKVKNDKYDFEMVKPVESMYSCHIEYQYLFKKGDCIDLNTLKDTWYIYPIGKFNVTKMALATEELYKKYQLDKGIEIKKGLA